MFLYPQQEDFTINHFQNYTSLKIPFGELIYFSNFINSANQKSLFDYFTYNIPWSQEEIVMFGKKITVPRLTAWYGDKSYTYSGKTHFPKKWDAELLQIKKRIEENFQINLNSVLLNHYQNGSDYMGWHSDDEKSLGRNPIIASVNLGESRRFVFRNKENHKQKVEILLESGSLLIMQGAIQHHWQHTLPKQKKATNPRINLTYRLLFE